MPMPDRDKLSLADLMILIAATGFGLGCFVLVDDGLFGGGRYVFGLFRPWGSPNASTILDRARGVLSLMMVAFGGWTFVLPILARRRPRPIRRRVVRSAGLSACVSAIVGVGAVALPMALGFLLRWLEGRTTLQPNFGSTVPILESVFTFPGVAVAATWTSQRLAGRWWTIAHPIDRIGRAIGVLWISATLAFATRLFLG